MRVAGLVAGTGCVVLVSALTPPVSAYVAPGASGRPAAAPVCNPPQGQPANMITQEPWPQRRLDFEEAWKITRGEGETVAVVDSGVAADHPQLRGRVVAQNDVSRTTPRDCNGHGTQVAGIIGGADMRQTRGIPFVGVAPGARLINSKFTAGESTSDNTLLPKAIRWAADRARVINVSVAAPDTPALRQAVQYAQRKDVLIVAAAGNVRDEQKGQEQPAYPASYPGVLSVAAADESGTIAGFSNIKSRIDVSAPGEGIISTGATGYVGGLGGTSFGAPYAAGVAALVRARHKKLTYLQVINRIKVTAEGGNGLGSGNGMISPLQAVSAVVDPSENVQQGGVQRAAGPIAIAPAPTPDHRARAIGGGIAAGAILLSLLVVFCGVAMPLGRRRGWRPGRARVVTEQRD